MVPIHLYACVCVSVHAFVHIHILEHFSTFPDRLHHPPHFTAEATPLAFGCVCRVARIFACCKNSSENVLYNNTHTHIIQSDCMPAILKSNNEYTHQRAWLIFDVHIRLPKRDKSCAPRISYFECVCVDTNATYYVYVQHKVVKIGSYARTICVIKLQTLEDINDNIR